MILNNTMIPNQPEYFYIDDIKNQSSDSLLKNYTLKYWSNITLENLTYSNRTIYMQDQEPFAIYIKFKLDGYNISRKNYIVISLKSDDKCSPTLKLRDIWKNKGDSWENVSDNDIEEDLEKIYISLLLLTLIPIILYFSYASPLLEKSWM